MIVRASAPGELCGLFPGLQVESYEACRWVAPEAATGGRSEAAQVARRPESGRV